MGEDISPENMERLANAEVFLLYTKENELHSLIVMDMLGHIRERKFVIK